jgi:hypothetical protein
MAQTKPSDRFDYLVSPLLRAWIKACQGLFDRLAPFANLLLAYFIGR